MLAPGCAGRDVYKDASMDFGLIQTVAVMPFANLTKEPAAADRMRDVFMTMLLARSGLYVLPPGEIARGIVKAAIANPGAPSSEEAVRFGSIVKADVVVTGVVREYGELRSATTLANAVSVSVEMVETQTGRVIWAASATRGGIGVRERMFGGGGEPMNKVSEDAVNELLQKLFR
jgi:hypothetical protein